MTKLMIAALALTSFSAFAAETKKPESQSTMKVEDLTEKNKAPGDDVDEVITNKKMRAEAGSKSKWSLSNTVNYQGGTLEKPLAENRPNITGGSDPTDFAALTDKLGLKYAITQKQAVLAGIGVRWMTPLQSADKKPDGYSGDKFDASNPYVNYQHVYKWAGIQSVLLAGPTFYTQVNSRQRGYFTQMLLQQNNVYEIGKTGLSVGLLVATTGTVFDKSVNGRKGDAGYSTNLLPAQADYSFGLYPFIEYTINDRLNLRTISGVAVFDHYRSEKRALTFKQNTMYQSFGLGISVARDLFLYPNVQIIPEDIRADRTNVALSANINVF